MQNIGTGELSEVQVLRGFAQKVKVDAAAKE